MKTKKLLTLTSAIAGILLAGSTVGALAQTSLYVDNASFELPATGKIGGGWDVAGANDVPGWHNMGAAPNDSGIEGSGSGHTGSYGAYCQGGGAAGAYQITTNTMTWGKKYTLTWWSGNDYLPSDSPQRVAIISAAATNTPFGSCTEVSLNNSTVPSFSAYAQYTQTLIAGNAQVGKYIGMDFGNAVGFGWMAFDDFALTEEDASPAELLPTIITQPVGASAYEGDSVALTVAATGPDLAYQWQAGIQGSGIYTNLPGATNATLSYSWWTAANTADYVVIITNTAGSATSTVASVTITPATYDASGLFNADFELPNTGKISGGFDVSGNGVPGWKNAGPNQNDTGIEGSGSGHTGSYAAYLHRGQSGAYQISTNVMHLGDSVAVSWYSHNVYAGVSNSISILGASSQGAAFGSSTILANSTFDEENGNWHQTSLTYTAQAGDVGKFIGVAFQTTDPATATGWVDYDDFAIVITPAAAAPNIVAEPASQTDWLGTTATFTVGAGGSGLNYQWQAGAVGSGIYTNISNGGQFSGATTATLTISNITVANGLDYVVIVTNTGGSVTSAPAATLTVNTAAPNIGTIQSKTVFQYDTTTLSPSYTDGATAYQWQAGAIGSGIYTNLSNGGRFSGVNSNILAITSVLPADGLDYVLIASNAGGSSTNGPATLTVTPVIYLEAFTTTNLSIAGIGWVADAPSGMYGHIDGGVQLFANDSAITNKAFYTTTKLDTGSTGPAFPIIKLADVSNLTFSVDNQSYYQAYNLHTFLAVQINGNQWYVSASEIPQAGGGWVTQTITLDTNSYAWNDLTVSGTGGTNTASVPLIGSTSTTGLTGYITGAGLVVSASVASYTVYDNFRITGDGFTVLPGLSIAPSGSNLTLTWGYGTLVESTNVTGPWAPASGTSPLTVSPTGGSRFYGLQLP